MGDNIYKFSEKDLSSLIRSIAHRSLMDTNSQYKDFCEKVIDIEEEVIKEIKEKQDDKQN